jgi:LysM repeat protein
MPPSANYITIRSASGSVSALLDDTTPTITDGYGGWQEVQRARRTAYVDWPGKNTLKMQVGIVFDGFMAETDVSGQVKTLEGMALPVDGTLAPPHVTISGFVPHTDLTWVIDTITWGETDRNAKGILIRQKLTVTFWQYVPEDIIVKSLASKTRTASKAKSAAPKGTATRSFSRSTYGYDPTIAAPATTLYVAKAGDTLNSIAAKQLGDYKRWTEIADLNHLTNPFAKFKGGEKLKVPVR